MSRYARVRLNRWQVGTSGSSRPMLLKRALPPTITYKAVETLRKYLRLLGSSLSRKSSKTLPESAKTYRTFAGQEYCEGQALISKEEQDEVLAVPGLRP